jgi:hypothetical protein
VQGLRHLLVILLLGGLPLRALDVIVHGRVVDENAAPVPGARVTLRPGPIETQSGPTGTFTVTLSAPGHYVIHVDRDGYYELKDQTVEVEGSREITLVINTVREVFQSMDVNERPSPIDLAQTQKEERLSGTIVNDIPYPASHSLRNSMKLMPGVVQDSTGALHFNGSSEDQVLYLLNGFNITDPITGRLQTRLGMEGVRSLQYSSGLYSPEFGKGSAGALAIRTNSGADEFRYTATNFLPGADMQDGIRLGDWYPRFGFSGPIVRRRAWFADNIDAEYNQAVVSGLPRGANTRSGWAGGNLLHTQVNITPTNILFADFLVNINHEGRVGLGPLDPVSTTLNLRSRQYFASVKDQAYLGRGALIEFGYAHNYVAGRQFSHGRELYVVSPGGRSGNHFQNFNQTASRDQILADAYLPAFRLAGTHQIKTGADANRLHYTGDFRRTGYQIVGLSGQLLSRTMYQGPAFFRISDTEMSFYVLDSWRLNKHLQVDLGVRHDWDQQIRDHAWSPRIAFSWAPFAAGRTRLSGGYAVTHDAVNFNLLGRPMDQVAATVQYNADGTPSGPASMATFARGSGPLRLPRGTNWSLGVDHQLKEHVFASAYYMRRRGSDGFTFVNATDAGEPPFESSLSEILINGRYQLMNLRRDNFDKVEVSVRQTLKGQHEWMASYTFSRAHTNSVLNLHDRQSLQVTQTLQPLPWDTPNRLMGWAYLPMPWKDWAIAVLADARTGFPFSIQDEAGRVVGSVNAQRYPWNFDLNVHLERMFTLRGYRFALRGGVNNATGRANPTAVNNTAGSPQFLQFYGEEGRHFVARIRFFGRASGK